MGTLWLLIGLTVGCTDDVVGSLPPLPLVTAEDAPAGSGWHAALRPPHLRHLRLLTSAAARRRRIPNKTAASANTPTHHDPPACPNARWAAAAQVAGLLSVKLFGAVGNGTHDDALAVEAAMNASDLCGGCVFFPPTHKSYRLGKTVALRGCIRGGGGGGGAQDQVRPSVQIYGPAVGPAVSISGGNVFVSDLTFNGGTLAVYIANAAIVRFVNVGAQITRMGSGIDKVDSSAEGCRRTACNVVLGSMNAAMVIENSFWLWFERCSFTAQANSGVCVHPYKQPCGWGQRPSVLMRGQGTATLPEVLDDRKGYGIAEVTAPPFSFHGLCEAASLRAVISGSASHRSTSCASTALSSPGAGCSTSRCMTYSRLPVACRLPAMSYDAATAAAADDDDHDRLSQIPVAPLLAGCAQQSAPPAPKPHTYYPSTHTFMSQRYCRGCL
eukprot:COSAG01_NODE_2091_length_8453_cov_19.448049_8_plen_441_part_00